ncbi:hypothetical protein [Pseudoalteromonas apostichopi]|uniref:hypothetical protein n=1 Tax=Pseudoalteromonas apostichopi TaxID=3035452 RepID=UPI002573AF5F|nr:hypothetical protein [Pseudoalteromonas sp. FE4]
MANDLEKKLFCGIVMPISPTDGCSEKHWEEVLLIIKDSISDAGFDSALVSESDDSGVIQKRIVQNLYDNPIVVCDVSAKNPNVMFELGMRLAFDKPTIIIKDDITPYSFDTSAIEHLEYPRDLRFSKIVDFKKKLKEKVKSTYEKSQDDKNYTTFLKHFGEFKVAKIESKEVSSDTYILEELKLLRQEFLKQTNKRADFNKDQFLKNDRNSLVLNYLFPNEDSAKNLTTATMKYDFIKGYNINKSKDNLIELTFLVDVGYAFSADRNEFDALILKFGGVQGK